MKRASYLQTFDPRMIAAVLIVLVGTVSAAPLAAQETATAEVVAEVVSEQPTIPPPPKTAPRHCRRPSLQLNRPRPLILRSRWSPTT